jgi:hypothetical protein
MGSKRWGQVLQSNNLICLVDLVSLVSLVCLAYLVYLVYTVPWFFRKSLYAKLRPSFREVLCFQPKL